MSSQTCSRAPSQWWLYVIGIYSACTTASPVSLLQLKKYWHFLGSRKVIHLFDAFWVALVNPRLRPLDHCILQPVGCDSGTKHYNPSTAPPPPMGFLTGAPHLCTEGWSPHVVCPVYICTCGMWSSVWCSFQGVTQPRVWGWCFRAAGGRNSQAENSQSCSLHCTHKSSGRANIYQKN